MRTTTISTEYGDNALMELDKRRQLNLSESAGRLRSNFVDEQPGDPTLLTSSQEIGLC